MTSFQPDQYIPLTSVGENEADTLDFESVTSKNERFTLDPWQINSAHDNSCPIKDDKKSGDEFVQEHSHQASNEDLSKQEVFQAKVDLELEQGIRTSEQNFLESKQNDLQSKQEILGLEQEDLPEKEGLQSKLKVFPSQPVLHSKQEALPPEQEVLQQVKNQEKLFRPIDYEGAFKLADELNKLILALEQMQTENSEDETTEYVETLDSDQEILTPCYEETNDENSLGLTCKQIQESSRENCSQKDEIINLCKEEVELKQNNVLDDSEVNSPNVSSGKGMPCNKELTCLEKNTLPLLEMCPEHSEQRNKIEINTSAKPGFVFRPAKPDTQGDSDAAQFLVATDFQAVKDISTSDQVDQTATNNSTAEEDFQIIKEDVDSKSANLAEDPENIKENKNDSAVAPTGFDGKPEYKSNQNEVNNSEEQHSDGNGMKKIDSNNSRSIKENNAAMQQRDDESEEQDKVNAQPNPITNLNLLLKLQKNMAVLQMQLSNLQDSIRATNVVVQELMDNAFASM